MSSIHIYPSLAPQPPHPPPLCYPCQVSTPRLRVRLLWVLAEHLSLAGTSAVFADEPREPLNVLIACIHRILFTPEAAKSNRSQDIEVRDLRNSHLTLLVLFDNHIYAYPDWVYYFEFFFKGDFMLGFCRSILGPFISSFKFLFKSFWGTF